MITFQVPAGPMNLKPLFPTVDFNKVEEYYVELVNQEDDGVIMTTTKYNKGCCCSEDTMRIFFVNYSGAIDGINFTTVLEEHETSSSRWKKKLPAPMQKWDGGLQRFNVSATDIVTVENRCYGEKDKEWMKEFLDSPNAWVQWFGTQGQSNDYLPIVILDGKFVTRKNVERYHSVWEVQFVYANEKIILRN